MKKYFFCLIMLFVSAAVVAQTPAEEEVQAPATPKHVLFEGVEMKGDIFEFSNALQKAGFDLKKRDANDRSYVFSGNVLGTPTVFKVNFTRETRTVYRIMAQLKNVPLDEILKELNSRYGEPYNVTERGYQWQQEFGAIMLGTPEGYDPTLVVMDAEGVGRYKEEE